MYDVSYAARRRRRHGNEQAQRTSGPHQNCARLPPRARNVPEPAEEVKS